MGIGFKKNPSYEILDTPRLFYIDVRFRDVVSPNRSGGKIKQIQKQFITYNLKIKGNTPYSIIIMKKPLPH